MRRNFVDIKVEIVKENEDGSADALVHFDKEGLGILVQYGIISMLTKAINEYASDLKISKKKVKK
jgi:hypothetical protein